MFDPNKSGHIKISFVGLLMLLLTAISFGGCSGDSDQYNRTLFVTLRWQADSLRYVDHTLAPTEYSGKLTDDGIYQVQLRDGEGNIVERVGFQPLFFETDAATEQDFTIALPYSPEIFRMMIYRLDGSSGHYTLKGQEPLLDLRISD